MTLQQRAAEVAKKANDQHGRIRGALIAVAVAMERCTLADATRDGPTEVIAALDALGYHLDRHFAGEERMRLHEHLAVLVPEEAGALQELAREHEVLRAMARGCHRSAWRTRAEQLPALREEIERFLRRLHAHEDAEDRMMRRALAGWSIV